MEWPPFVCHSPPRVTHRRNQSQSLGLVRFGVTRSKQSGGSISAGRHGTLGGFFYHFKDKNELAKELMQRYIATNDAILDDIMRRADELNDDPLHGFLVSLKLFAELLADLPGGHPGCLVASFCYQDQMFSGEIRALTRTGVEGWRKRFRDRLEKISERYPPRIPVNIDELADMANALVDGGIIMTKVFNDATILPKQVLLYRDLIRMIFQPA